jgi:hypothetical protein
MNFIAKMLLPIFRNYILDQISKEENKTYIVAKINEYIDLPKMSEEEELIIMGKIYDAVAEISKSYLGKIK